MQDIEFVAEPLLGLVPSELGGAEFSGRDVHVREPDQRRVRRVGNGRQEIVLLGFENLQIRGCARRDHADDVAAHEFFPGARFFQLFAQRDFVSRAKQPGDVALGGVMRNAAHGDGLALFAVAGGQSDLQLAGGNDGVLVKEFVEIAQAEQDQRMRVALLDGLVLPH